MAGVTTKRPKSIVGFAAIAAGICVPYAPNNPPHCVLTKAWLVDALALLAILLAMTAASPVIGKAETPSWLMPGMTMTALVAVSQASAERENIN